MTLEDADVNDDDGGSDDVVPFSDSSDSGELSPEERDIQNARDKYGVDLRTGEQVSDRPQAGERDQRPLSMREKDTPTPPDEGDEAPDQGDPAEDESDAEETETEVTVESEDDLVQLSDEDLEDWLDAVGDERFMEHPRVAELIEKRAAAAADARFEERQREVSVTVEQTRLIEQGKQSVKGVYDILSVQATGLQAAQAELRKAINGEAFDPNVVDTVLDQMKVAGPGLRNQLGIYGGAIIAEMRRDVDTGFAESFKLGRDVVGPLTQQENAHMVQILATAKRIESDPKQGMGPAQTYLWSETAKFNVQRAFAAGQEKAKVDFERRRAGAQNIRSKNAEVSATARIVRERQQLPPRTPAPVQGSDSGGASLETYQAAKARGASPAELDRITSRMGG